MTEYIFFSEAAHKCMLKKANSTFNERISFCSSPQKFKMPQFPLFGVFLRSLLDEILKPILKITLKRFIQQILLKTHAKQEKYTRAHNQTVTAVFMSFN